MSIKFDCRCGKILRVRDDLAGTDIRCPDCDENLVVPDGETTIPQAVRADGTPVRPSKYRKDGADDYEPRSGEREQRRVVEEKPSLSARAPILIGILMMVGALVWFFVALAAGTIFFYPPILFIIGIVSVVRGILARTAQYQD